MKILVCPDSYKGSADARSVAYAIKRGFERISSDFECITLPIADGGEGSVAVIAEVLGAEWVYLSVKGPYGESVRARYAISGKRAYIEMAEASGICLTERREPLLASTYGTGELIYDAVSKGAEEITVFIGGSATCDGGIGMAAALGYGFFDFEGNELSPIGESLSRIASIHPPEKNIFKNVKIYCACDVKNTLYGKLGAAHVFGPQKGADESAVLELDRGLFNLAGVIEGCLGIDVHTLEGGGAAGGLGAGLYAFCGARMRAGFSLIAETLGLDEMIGQADAVVTGEGCTDAQSVMGKVIGEISAMCKHRQKPCIVISGLIKDGDELLCMGIDEIYSCTDIAGSAERSIAEPARYIELAAQEAAKSILVN